jgi:hypothetical protein
MAHQTLISANIDIEKIELKSLEDLNAKVINENNIATVPKRRKRNK